MFDSVAITTNATMETAASINNPPATIDPTVTIRPGFCHALVKAYLPSIKLLFPYLIDTI
jgi:hypothetical protein